MSTREYTAHIRIDLYCYKSCNVEKRFTEADGGSGQKGRPALSESKLRRPEKRVPRYRMPTNRPHHTSCWSVVHTKNKDRLRFQADPHSALETIAHIIPHSSQTSHLSQSYHQQRLSHPSPFPGAFEAFLSPRSFLQHRLSPHNHGGHKKLRFPREPAFPYTHTHTPIAAPWVPRNTF